MFYYSKAFRKSESMNTNIHTRRDFMALRVAINGFGRIGRMVLRAASKDKKIEFVAINDLTDAATLAHLFKYDSVHGIFPGKVEHTADSLIINGTTIKIYAVRNPAELPWKKDKIDVVLESTGLFTARDKAELHISKGRCCGQVQAT